jgi:putative hydrolase of the HAD superfamily
LRNKAVDIKFVYFDVDDTLVDTTGAVAAAYEAALAEIRPAVAEAGGEPPAPSLEAEMLGTFGSTMPREYLLAWLYETGVDDGRRGELAARAEAVYERRTAHLPPFPEAEPTLAWLASRAVGLGIISDGRTAEQRAKLEAAGLAAFFGPMFVSEDYAVFQHKPSQAMFDEALRAAGVPPEAVMYVGDRNKDVVGANLAGMVSVRILQGWANREPRSRHFAAAQADYVIKNLGELPGLFGEPGGGANA